MGTGQKEMTNNARAGLYSQETAPEKREEEDKYPEVDWRLWCKNLILALSTCDIDIWSVGKPKTAKALNPGAWNKNQAQSVWNNKRIM